MFNDVICLGEILIDLFAPTGESLSSARLFERAPGGAPANVAAALGKLGVRVGFIGKVGADPFGQLLRDTLVDASVDVSHLSISHSANTTLAWVAKPSTDTSEFLFYRNPGADAQLQQEDVDLTLLQHARIFHFGTVSMSLEPARSTTLEAARMARKAGVMVSFDPNWRPSLWSGPQEGQRWILEGMAIADIVKLNHEELTFVTGASDNARGARFLRERGARLVVVTRGADGAYFQNQNAEGFVPGFHVQVEDTTGCGDAFMAALLSRLLELSEPLEQLDGECLMRAVRYANAAGALTARCRGVIPALPTREEIGTLLKKG